MGTPTTNLGLYKPDEGEDAWADSVNASFDAIDSAVAGIQQTLPELVVTVPSSGTALEIDPALGTVWAVTVDNDCTITFAIPDTPTAGLTVKLEQSGSGNTITWGTEIGWENTTAPTLQTTGGGIDILTFVYFPDVPGWFGFPSALNIGSPNPTYPTLGFELLASPTSSTANLSPYVFGSTYFLGDQRLGIVFVVNTDGTGNDPPTPTLTGAGASSWVMEETVTNNSTSVAGRRLSMFVARDAVSGSPGPLTVTVSGSPTGCVLVGVRTTGAVLSSALTLASSKAVHASNAGGTAITWPFAAAADAANRQVIAFFQNQESYTATPEANFVEMAATNMLNPSIKLFVYKNETAFDTTPTATVNSTPPLTVRWGSVGTEVEQP